MDYQLDFHFTLMLSFRRPQNHEKWFYSVGSSNEENELQKAIYNVSKFTELVLDQTGNSTGVSMIFKLYPLTFQAALKTMAFLRVRFST